jgi:glyceraldehyde-3-phosphate dehydrogenase/erythrose-4-phosphate dehydrogenase
MINFRINGYGRIVRVLHRLTDLDSNLNIIAINDVNPDINNIAYLANYDSTYGRRDFFLTEKNNSLTNDKKFIDVFHEPKISEVPWSDLLWKP